VETNVGLRHCFLTKIIAVLKKRKRLRDWCYIRFPKQSFGLLNQTKARDRANIY